jgi:hypothetical protein
MSKLNSPPLRNRVLYGSLAITVFAIASGVVFAAWIDNGPQILMALSMSALAWCF